MTSEIGSQIIEKAKEMRATLAGIASVEMFKQSPAHRMLSKFGTKLDGVYSDDLIKDFHEIIYPPNAWSALVVALSHPQDKPDLIGRFHLETPKEFGFWCGSPGIYWHGLREPWGLRHTNCHILSS